MGKEKASLYTMKLSRLSIYTMKISTILEIRSIYIMKISIILNFLKYFNGGILK